MVYLCPVARSNVSTFAEPSTVMPTFRFSMRVLLRFFSHGELTEGPQDPLSALDTHVGMTVFQRVFVNNTKGRTKILVTHALHFLPHVDYIYAIVDGQIVERGAYAELMANDGVFSKFVREFGSRQDEDEEEGKGEKGPDSITPREKSEGGRTIMQEEERNVGAVTWKVYKTYLTAGNGYILVPGLLLSFLLVQGVQVMSSYWLVFWQEQQFHQPIGFYVSDVSAFPMASRPDILF